MFYRFTQFSSNGSSLAVKHLPPIYYSSFILLSLFSAPFLHQSAAKAQSLVFSQTRLYQNDTYANDLISMPPPKVRELIIKLKELLNRFYLLLEATSLLISMVIPEWQHFLSKTDSSCVLCFDIFLEDFNKWPHSSQHEKITSKIHHV